MPPTPFIGISSLIHLCIIFMHKVFHWVPRRKIIHKKATMSTHFFSVFIVTLIFWFMIVSAGVMVYVSAKDKHSIFNTILKND